MLNLIEAAQEAGMSKSALHRAIQRGDISISRTDAGGIRIDRSELARYTSSRASRSGRPPAGGNETDGPIDGPASRDAETAVLRAENAMQREMIADLKAQR